MASAVTVEEMRNLRNKLKATQERVRGDRKEALRVLQAAGITTKEGKLTSHYRETKD